MEAKSRGTEQRPREETPVRKASASRQDGVSTVMPGQDTAMQNEEPQEAQQTYQEGLLPGSAPAPLFLNKLGPLTLLERQQKILRFIAKKSQKSLAKKFTYECRKQVAEKRLRIKGRFVTKQQAFEILGLREDDLKTNESLQRLLEQHYNINN